MSSKNPVVSKNRRSNYPNWTVLPNVHILVILANCIRLYSYLMSQHTIFSHVGPRF